MWACTNADSIVPVRVVFANPIADVAILSALDPMQTLQTEMAFDKYSSLVSSVTPLELIALPFGDALHWSGRVGVLGLNGEWMSAKGSVGR